MTIRRATPSDSKEVSELIFLAIQDIAYQLTGETTEDRALASLEAYFLKNGNRFSYDKVSVKIADESVAGMILCYEGSEADSLYEPILRHLRRKNGDPDFEIDRETDAGEYYIDALAVFPEYGGRGYARQLLDAAEQCALDSNCSRIALNVEKNNEKAHSLYRKLGYEENKTITINGHLYRHMIKKPSPAQIFQFST
ncbi:GNAT family N-acetyltransferase [Cohnella faecalis]|uniref:GNAT family N-acetyltransferase n=1 Tax=Cohnella faecalis TaxID=2315694 RepID=A0A398CY33_9BACL|nr:GNAT family N-acetyltransferase [Cohnella faecalis]RIE03904.1 GNAT family N-acetyltransferase [Cohnella faecalis]